MAFTAYKTQAVGDPLIAADWNTYVRDNGNEGVVAKSTAAGDMAYATAANTLTRLAIGTSGYVLTSSGGLPNWGEVFGGFVVGSTRSAGHVEGNSTAATLSTSAATRIVFSTGYGTFAAAPWVTFCLSSGGGDLQFVPKLYGITTTGFWIDSVDTPQNAKWIAIG